MDSIQTIATSQFYNSLRPTDLRGRPTQLLPPSTHCCLCVLFVCLFVCLSVGVVLSVYLFLFLLFCYIVYLFVCVCLYACLSLLVSFCLFVSFVLLVSLLCVCLFACLFYRCSLICWGVCLCVFRLFVFVVRLFVCMFIHLFVCLFVSFVYLFACVFVCFVAYLFASLFDVCVTLPLLSLVCVCVCVFARVCVCVFVCSLCVYFILEGISMLLPILFHPIQSSVAISTSSYTPHPIPFAFYSNKAMPGFCLIRYSYKAHHDDGTNVKEGTMLAISKRGGRAYTQQWCPIKFGTALPMPMNYFTTEKPDINLRPVDDMPGKAMRAYLSGRRVEYIEATIFKNYHNDLDVYERHSTWEDDLFNHYRIHGRSDPNLWITAKRCVFIKQVSWPYEDMIDTASSVGENVQAMLFIGLIVVSLFIFQRMLFLKLCALTLRTLAFLFSKPKSCPRGIISILF